jgi:hypothetical protein
MNRDEACEGINLMERKNTNPQKRVRLVTAAILFVGFSSAVVIYLTAGEPAENPLIDQLENSKIYRRSLELYGGKANLLAEEFSRWFGSLWRGKSLAFTVTIITVVIAAGYWFIAAPLPPDEK